MWNLAIKTLIADRGKLTAALIGVIFSVVLVNVQGGLFFGLIRKASLLVDHGRSDIWVGHKKMNNVDFPQDIPRSCLQRIRAIPGILDARPYVVGHSVMTLPDGGFEYVLVVGCDSKTLLGAALPAGAQSADAIRQPDGVLVDSYDAHKIGNPRLGDIREIGRHRARIVGFTHGILGFLVTPYVFTTLDRAVEFLNRPADVCSYFLVQLEPGADAQAVCAAIHSRVPELEALTRNQYATASIRYWLQRTGLGISFGAATGLGLLVGLVIVAQTLYASVLDRLTDFAALKAIGAQDRQVRALILEQALALASVGTVLGIACVATVQYLFSTPRAPIAIPWYLSTGSFLVVTVVCLLAAMLPYWRVRSIDPAIVLQS